MKQRLAMDAFVRFALFQTEKRRLLGQMLVKLFLKLRKVFPKQYFQRECQWPKLLQQKQEREATSHRKW